MSYVIRYYTASHMGVHGDYATIDEAREAFAGQEEWYAERCGAIVEGTRDFTDDVKRAESIS